MILELATSKNARIGIKTHNGTRMYRHTADKPDRYIGTRHNHATAHAQAGDRHTPSQMIDTRPVLFVSCVETL